MCHDRSRSHRALFHPLETYRQLAGLYMCVLRVQVRVLDAGSVIELAVNVDGKEKCSACLRKRFCANG